AAVTREYPVRAKACFAALPARLPVMPRRRSGMPRRDHHRSDPMKLRHVFSTPDLATAELAMEAARSGGVLDDDILLVARSDIEVESIPNERKEADTDLMPAAARGAGYGAGAGLLAGLVALAIPPLGITLAGAAAATVAGAVVGCWASALVG